MRAVFTGEEMRRVDERAVRELGIPSATLMENAGRAAADAVLAWLRAARRTVRDRRAVIVCGKGGNGGDGFVVARHLARRGVRCDVLLTTPRTAIRGDAATKLRALEKAGLRATLIEGAAALPSRLARADVIVDALLGTGARGPIDGLIAATIEAVNAARRPVIALDIPSGLAADGAEAPRLAVRADLTVTFAGLKRALITPAGRVLAGRVVVVDIGIPASAVTRDIATFVLEDADVARQFPPRARDTHKGTYGHLLVVAGSMGKTGAAALAANAALRAGAGLVTVATAASQQPVVAGLVLEAMTAPLPDDGAGAIDGTAWSALMELVAQRDAIALGPGLGLGERTQAFARRAVSDIALPMVVDADALSALAGHLDLLHKAPAPRCLTPHPGELARMLGATIAEVQRDRVTVARDFATTHRVHVVLKGALSVIATPEGVVLLNPTGNPGMASGGTGDVLTGIVGAFLARGLAARDALASAVYLHGVAGDIAAERMGEESLIARDVIDALPAAFARLRDVELDPEP